MPTTNSATSTAHMQTNPTRTQRPGIRRASAAPSARAPSAVRMLADTRLLTPPANKATTPAASTRDTSATRGPLTTPTAATAARGGVASAARRIRPNENECAPSGAKVPTTTAPGNTAAQPGDLNRRRGSSALPRGNATSAPCSSAGAIAAPTGVVIQIAGGGDGTTEASD